jgi:NTE family protein
VFKKNKKIKIYVSATNIETNRIKVFDNKDICVESILASLCLPTINHAVAWKEDYFGMVDL